MKSHNVWISLRLLSYLPICVLVLAFASCSKKGDDFELDPRGVLSFVHPGILNTQSTLQLMYKDVNTTNSWRSQMFKSTVDGYIEQYYNNTATPYPSIVDVKSDGSTDTERRMRIDAQLAYALALKWVASADTIYANRAIAVLNGWSYNFKRYDTLQGSPFKQTYLEAAWVIPTFAAAAEIIRYYKSNNTKTASWADKDVKQFEGFLLNLVNNYSDKTFEDGTNINNWYVSATLARMATGIFTNNTSMYNDGYAKMEFIMTKVITMDGIVPEYCYREDCSHFQYSVTGITLAAEIDRIQTNSEKLYHYGNERLSKAYLYTQKAYQGDISTCNYCNPTKEIYPGTAVANRYFNDAATAYILTLQQPPFGVNNDKTFMGFTMVTHFRMPR